MHLNLTHAHHLFFSPPKAPPISAPEVPMFTLAIPQSDPATDKEMLCFS
jgi:hypothetical protein